MTRPSVPPGFDNLMTACDGFSPQTLGSPRPCLLLLASSYFPRSADAQGRHHAKPYEATSSLEVDQCSAHPPQFAVATPLQIVELRNYYSRFITRLPPHSFPIYQTTGLTMSDLNCRNDNFKTASYFSLSSFHRSVNRSPTRSELQKGQGRMPGPRKGKETLHRIISSNLLRGYNFLNGLESAVLKDVQCPTLIATASSN